VTETRDAQKSQIAFRRGLLVGIGVGLIGVIGVVSAGYLGLLDGRLVRSPWAASQRAVSLSDTNATALEQLESALAAEVQKRRELAERLADLSAELSRLRLMAGEDGAGLLARGEPSPEDSTESGETNVDEGIQATGFDDEGLLSQGIDPRDVQRLHDLWVSQELDRSSIAYRALREGWFFTARHRTELAELDQALREDLEDEDYDRYLYARGEPNRIRAVEVLGGSAASEAGLRHGDIIMRYDDVRVFNPGELLLTAAQGEPGESVAMEILRDGRPRTLSVTRGPLGMIVKPSQGLPVGH
jgi:hypothetical protein